MMPDKQKQGGQDTTATREARETDVLITNSGRSNSISQTRRPYYYSPYGGVDDASAISIRSASMDTWSERANYSRYLYYSRLRREALDPDDDLLLIPPHVIPGVFFYPPFIKSSDGKQNSIITIFAVWNTMCGSSLLSIPWAMERAGLIPTIVLLFAMALINFYTAYRILEVYENNESPKIQDFAVLCKKLLGRWAQVLAIASSVLTLLGVSIVFWVLLSNFLYYTVDFLHTAAVSGKSPFVSNESDIYCPEVNTSGSGNASYFGDEDDLDPYHKIWDLHRTVPIFLIIILGPIICVRSPTFFAKFNSLGTLSVLYIIIFVGVKLYNHGINVTFVDTDSPTYIPLFKSNFPALIGMLSLSFFIHNSIVTIMKNNRNQRNNKRDLGIAFIFVALTYFLIGGLFYLVFPLEKSCIQDNFLDNFRAFDAWTFAARIFLFFQLMTVYPLIVYILKIQVWYPITKQEPTVFQTFVSNVVIVIICVSFAIYLPQIGTIIRFTGSIAALSYSFLLPISLYLVWQKNLNTLSNFTVFLHALLFLFGLLNFIAQFIVNP